METIEAEGSAYNKSSFVCLSLTNQPQCVQILWCGFRDP